VTEKCAVAPDAIQAPKAFLSASGERKRLIPTLKSMCRHLAQRRKRRLKEVDLPSKQSNPSIRRVQICRLLKLCGGVGRNVWHVSGANGRQPTIRTDHIVQPTQTTYRYWVLMGPWPRCGGLVGHGTVPLWCPSNVRRTLNATWRFVQVDSGKFQDEGAGAPLCPNKV
jgi:hypothetical protein